MATENQATMGVNGHFTPQQGYGSMDPHQQPQNGAYAPNASLQYHSTPQSSSTPAPTQQPEIPKDEVGWYFVEQYYTTLSRSPEKLYLFYNKRSQFVSGQETDKVAVCVGQRAINDRIKELDFQDCKVRVTNVDSQASDANIVIQVIGEISNRSQPHKKFTQTFVLATQTNGYFVLNDIFRYIIEEEDEQETTQAPPAVEEAQAQTEEIPPPAEAAPLEPAEPKTLTSSLEPAAVEHDAQVLDKELEEKVLNEQPQAEEAAPATTNGIGSAEKAETAQAEQDEAPITKTEEAPQAQSVAPEEPAALEPEKPQDPEPSPIASPAKASPAQPSAAPKSAAPKTWASLVSANRSAATPVMPTGPSSTTPTNQQQRAPAAAKAATPAPATPLAPSAPASQRDQSPAAPSQQDEWNTVGSNHVRQQSRQANQPQDQGPQYRGYVKNVTNNVDPKELRKAIEQHGELIYFDIAPQKNCAFIDFKTKEGYEAAMAAGPIAVSGNQLYVEKRKFKEGAFPFMPKAQYQAAGGRGRGGFQGRGGQGFPQRGGRGGAAARGRGAPQAS